MLDEIDAILKAKTKHSSDINALFNAKTKTSAELRQLKLQEIQEKNKPKRSQQFNFKADADRQNLLDTD